jgi:hypothetical protein
MKSTKIIHGVRIEKNVPMPAGVNGYRREILRAMEIGDSFVAPIPEREVWRRIALHMGVNLLTRTINAKEARIWKTDKAMRVGRPSLWASQEGQGQ